MTDFLHYIDTYYTPRRRMWTVAYRKGCRINVNMRIENFHKQFKHKFLNGKKSKRVDKCVQALLLLINGKVADRIIKMSRGKSNSRTSRIFQAHQKGLKMKKITYEIKFNSSHPSKCTYKCGLICRECGVCYNTAECQCFNYQVMGEICKHIHFTMQKKMYDRQELTAPVLVTRKIMRETKKYGSGEYKKSI